MKKFLLLFGAALPLLALFSCGSADKGPDVSNIKVDASITRFDEDFFRIDTNQLVPALDGLHAKYPDLTALFLRDVLGLDSSTTENGVKNFLRMSHNLHDTISRVFPDTRSVEADFKSAFQHLQYYFPKYPLPKIVAIAGPVDALAQSESGPTPDFLRPGILGISLQFYLGRQFSIYHDPFFIENVAPEYRSRRFSKEYIVPDALQLIMNDIYPDASSRKPLIEQMIEKGKRWWLLKKLMPAAPDSVLTGYTTEQLSWCHENEGLIWSTIVRNEDLNSISPAVIQTYIGESPFTQGFSQEYSPGNLGQWLGWQIVNKYVSKKGSVSPEELLKTDPKVIQEEAKYKPK